MKSAALRVVLDAPARPQVNMAADEVLSRSIFLREKPPFVRFYRWDPPSLSFGYFQSVEKLIDCAAAQSAGIGVVRRQSGGKMVFHADELTFSFGMPTSLLQFLSGGRSDFISWFNALLHPLLEALNKLGLPVRFAAANEVEHGRSNRVHCYAAAAGHSIYLNDKKLVGAAGLVQNGVFMVHGSLPIAPFKLPENILLNNIPFPQMAFLGDFLSRELIETLPMQTAACLAAKLSLNLLKSCYDDVEMCEIDYLSRNKYSCINWKQTWLQHLEHMNCGADVNIATSR